MKALNEKKLLAVRKRLAGLIRETRLSKRITQNELSLMTGLAKRTIIRIESGKVYWPGMKEFLLICDALGLFPMLLNKDREHIEEIKTTLAKSKYSHTLNHPIVKTRVLQGE